MKIDSQLAAFICGLFIGLMVVQHIRRKVVEVEVEGNETRGQERDADEKSVSRSRLTIEPKHISA